MRTSAPKPYHWVFDLDGTLVDSFSHYFESLSQIFGENGIEFTPDLQLPALTHPLPEFFKEHLGERALPRAFQLLELQSNSDAAQIQIFSGLETLLGDLVRQGSKVAVWTNRDLTSSSLILQQTGLHEHLAAFVSGSCVTDRKPHPEGLLKIIDQFGCKPDEVTVVGDHSHDVMAAMAIGARAVRASWHSYWTIETCLDADHQFYKVEDFRLWVERLQA